MTNGYTFKFASKVGEQVSSGSSIKCASKVGSKWQGKWLTHHVCLKGWDQRFIMRSNKNGRKGLKSVPANIESKVNY
jgi:hypothetical protein